MSDTVCADYAAVSEVRASDPAAIRRAWQNRVTRPTIRGNGRLMIVAADHPARGALAVGEMPAGDDAHVGCALRGLFARRGVGRIRMRRRADQDRGIIVEAIGPAELEEGIAEDHHQADCLQFPKAT